MANSTKKVQRKPVQKAAPAKAKGESKPKARRLEEAALLEKYPHAVKGTLAFQDEGKWKGKQTVRIRCQHPGCTAQREVATSDLFQVTMCEEHTAQARRERRAASRKAKAAEAA